MSVSPIVSVKIRNIAVGGAGVGEVVSQGDGKEDLLGIAAFVPYSIPGEKVSALVTSQKKRHLETELREIEDAAEERVVPRCKYYMACGGCELQHISYEGQLQAKYKMIDGALRAAKFPSEVSEALRPVTPGSPFSYRHRLTLHVDPHGKVGLYRTNSRSVVPIESCAISNQKINEALTHIQSFGKEVQGRISSVLLEADDQGIIAILKSPYDLGKAEAEQILNRAKMHFGNVKLVIGEKELSGSGRQILELPLNEQKSLVLQVPAGAFSQVNVGINQRLIAKVVEEIEVGARTKVLDLYAGAGNFSLPIAKRGGSVTAVECDPRLVSFGRENASRYGLEKKLEYVHSSVEKFLASQKDSLRAFDCILADPPRSGLGNLAGELPQVKKLLLISCHLPSFTRDLRTLIDRGYEVKGIYPFDMFAQTSYIEILAVLNHAP